MEMMNVKCGNSGVGTRYVKCTLFDGDIQISDEVIAHLSVDGGLHLKPTFTITSPTPNGKWMDLRLVMKPDSPHIVTRRFPLGPKFINHGPVTITVPITLFGAD